MLVRHLHFILHEAYRNAGLSKLSEAQSQHKSVESFSISELEQTGDLVFGRKPSFIGLTVMLIRKL